MEGGLTNRSYIVHCGSRRFVLRLDAEHTATFGLDRRVELKVLKEAAKASLAPQVHFADPDNGILVYEYLPGPVWSRSSLDADSNLERLAVLLRNVHRLPRAGIVLDTLSAAVRYEAIASRDPELHLHAARCVDIVRTSPAPGALCCCHNDVVAENVVGGESLKLIDWEYAADNDPFFDLASLIAFHDLDQAQADRLRDAYTGGTDSQARERLRIQLRLFHALQWLWFAARYVISPRHHHRDRLEALRERVL
jgi:thiamine kinase